MSPFYTLLRSLRASHGRAAGPAILVVGTLALALGANTAMVSLADGLLVRAVPFDEPARLVSVTTGFPNMKLAGMNLSGPEALEFSRLTTTFAASGAYTFTGLVVEGGRETELATGVQVSSGAADALRMRPFAGRLFTRDEYRPGGPAVAILGQGLWRRAFGGDPAVIGRVVQLGGSSREIVGIMPDGVSLLNRPVDVWLPLALDPSTAGSRSDHGYYVVARLGAGRTFAEAMADTARAMEIWRDETGEMHVPTLRMHPLELQPFTRATTGVNREPIGALLAAVALVLLIACANISNLLVARAERRRGDLAVRLALGATRRRLMADSIAEGIGLAVTASALGLGVASLLVDVVRSTWPVAALADVRLDYRVIGVSALLALLSGIVIGILPILRLDVGRAADWLKSGARGAIGTAGRLQLQRAMIVLQIGLAVLLTTSAGLMVRSLLAVTSIELGIDARDVVRAQISLPAGAYTEDAQVWSFYDRVLDRLAQTPGVTAAGVMSGLPPLRRANNTSFLLDGNETMDHTAIHQVDFVQHVSPDYLRTLGIAVIAGRALTQGDDQRAAPVALVNETLARRFWPDTNPIGRRLKPAGNIGTWFTVAGVVADSRQAGIQSPVGSEIYVTHRQARLLMSGFVPRTMNVVVRSGSDAGAVASTIRAAVNEADRSAALSEIVPMQTIVDRTIAQPRLLAWMLGAFAVLALVVAAVGVYAVTSYAVGSRTAEFGVRMALGAAPADIVRLVIGGGVPTIAAGILLGATAAVLAARVVRGLLFGVDALDPLSLASGAGIIAAATLLAMVLPACRAARVDPLTALRD